MSAAETILVTGATGYLGRRLVPRLRARGHRVRALVRGGDARARSFAHLEGCEVSAGDIGDPTSCEEAARGCSAVVHLVGIIREHGAATFESVHVDGTVTIVQAARNAGCRRFLYVSAIGARPDAPTAYWRTKARAEELVRTSGLNWLVLRPSIVVARDGEFYGVLLRLTRFLVVPILGPGTSRMAPLAADDLADIQARAFELPLVWNRVHAVCGPRAYTFDELVRIAARAWGRRVVLVHVPTALAEPLVALAGALLPSSPITPSQLAMLLEDSTCDAAAVEQAFGVELHAVEPEFARARGSGAAA